MKAHLSCPDCGSSDALLLNDDGSTHCFSCGKHTAPTDDNPHTAIGPSVNFVKGRIRAIPERHLTEETCKRYGYRVGEYKGRPCEIATYRDLEGNPQFQKIRFTDEKSFVTIGKSLPILYGAHLFRGQNKKIIITEGEIDCLSVSQAVKGYPVVSIPTGAQSAKKVIKANLDFLEKFEEVVLCFDMDEAGKMAVRDCAPLFSTGRCKIMSLPLKDPNEMLKQNRTDELYKATWNAAEYRPDGIVDKNTLWEEVQKPIEWGLSYPWDKLTKMTYGIRKSEMVVIGAGTGMGKTEFFKEIEAHLILKHKKRIGIIHLEENARFTTIGLMNKYSGLKFHLPDTKYTPEQFEEAFNTIMGDNAPCIYNGYGTTDFNIIKNVIHYMVKAKDCEYIFLDHVTAFADEVESAGEVNQKTRNIILQLANLTRELDIGLFTISHLRKSEGKIPHEEGGRVKLDDLYGAAALKQWTTYAFGLERNQQAESKEERHTTALRCLKDRYTGLATGNTVLIKYDEDTGRLFEKGEDTQTKCPFEDESEVPF